MSVAGDMTRSGVPDEARLLVERRIDSMQMLDVLLLLHRSPERSWAASETARALGTSEVSASAQLVALRQGGILSVEMTDDARYTYQPRPELAAAVDALAAHFRENPLEVAELIASRPKHTLRIFADAFRLRKDE
jgi:hypothetical protein